jgi:outer membrane protein TolC
VTAAARAALHFAVLTIGTLGAFGMLAIASPLSAQVRAAAQTISLEQALRMAEAQSEAVGMAKAGVTRADGEVFRAHSQAMPQISGSASYTRTLKSQFSGFNSATDSSESTTPAPPGPCNDYLLGPSATTAERLAGLEDAQRCANGSNPFSGLGRVGFGAANQYNLGVSLSQPIYTGGRLAATNSVASAGHHAAETALASARAQIQMDVTQAYFDAALSDRLVQIAESALVQTETVFRQTSVAKQVGNQSEFELLRAQVSRDNQRPVVIQRRADRDLAYYRLKQLIEIPADAPLSLSSSMQDTTIDVVRLLAARIDTSAGERAAVHAAEDAVAVQRGLLKMQRSERLPAVSLTSSFGRVAFPGKTLPSWNDFRSNWTIGIGMQMPLFTGGRLRGDALVADADLAESELHLKQSIEMASLDARAAASALAEAVAAWDASAGTAEQAKRAYAIAVVRYDEGISSQVELSDSRLLLQQAEANRAVAARDMQVARVRMALLRDLPLGAGLSGGSSAAGVSGAASSGGQRSGANQRATQQQQNANTQISGAPGIGGGPGQ